jgi:O-antigen ligase
MYETKYKDIFFMMFLIAISIIVNGLIFPETNAIYGLVNGRYSGFMINPNNAGVACMLGMALSYSIKNIILRYTGQIILTFAGFLTLSRTFIVVWTVLVLISIIKDKKNLVIPFFGVIAFIILTTFTDSKNFASDRFEAFTSFFEKGEVKTKTISHDTRDQTWALYYDLIFQKPIQGHGFMFFQNMSRKLPGVHNSFLMVIGESGIVPFLIFLGIYVYLFRYCLFYFKKEPYLMYVLIVVLLNLMVSHTFFFNFQSIALSIFIFVKLRQLNEGYPLE